MNKVLCCSFLLLSMCLQLSAQETRWKILLTDGKELSEITPTSVTSDSVLFQSAAQKSGGVPISEIRMVTYRIGPSNAGRGFVIGLLGGGAVGYLTGLILDGSQGGPLGDNHGTEYKVVLPILGGLVGGFTGMAMGSGAGRRSLDLALLSADEKRQSLARLLNPGSTEYSMVSSPFPQFDIVHLKNGNIIRGTILEMIPDSTLRMTSADGSLFIFKMPEVERVEKSHE